MKRHVDGLLQVAIGETIDLELEDVDDIRLTTRRDNDSRIAVLVWPVVLPEVGAATSVCSES